MFTDSRGTFSWVITQNVYAWEREYFVQHPVMSRKFAHVGEVVMLLDALSLTWWMPPTRVYKTTDVMSKAIDIDKIYFSDTMWDMHTLLHEYAHLLVHDMGLAETGHGPTWVSVFAILVEKTLGINAQETTRNALFYGNIEYRDLELVERWMNCRYMAKREHAKLVLAQVHRKIKSERYSEALLGVRRVYTPSDWGA